jgi:multidrug transporter EmrE-like cation transporter
MTGVAPPPIASRSPAPIRWFLNPYVQIGIGALTVTASELLMKAGANATAMRPTIAGGWLGIAALASLWTWAGIVCYIASFLSWIYVLRSIPLGIAYALINFAHVLVPIGSWVFLKEAIGLSRWCGIALVVLGLALLIGPVAKVEDKL